MTRRMRAAAGAVLGLGCWWLLSCGDGGTGPPPPPGIPVCTDSVTVSVTLDTLPLFSWTPDCTIGRLIVEQGLDEYWGTETCGENTYQSPIRYGISPPNYCPEEPATDLAPGLRYKVSLWRFVTVNPESLQLLGFRHFTYLAPPPECTDSVTVSVTIDSLPLFSWTPDCAIGRLIVEQGLDYYWRTETCGQNTYASPIRYGRSLPNTCPGEPAIPLASGLTYKVSVWRFVTVTPESLQLLGFRDFVY